MPILGRSQPFKPWIRTGFVSASPTSSTISDTDFSPSSQDINYISSVVNGIDSALYVDSSNILSNLIFYDLGSYSDSIPRLAASYSGTDSASYSDSIPNILVPLVGYDLTSLLDVSFIDSSMIYTDSGLYSDSIPNLLASFYGFDSASSGDTPSVLSSSCISTDSGLYLDSIPNILISSWIYDSTSGVDVPMISASFASADSVSGLESPGSVLSVVLLVSTDSIFTIEQTYSIINAIVTSNDLCSLVEILGVYTAIQAVMRASDSGISIPYSTVLVTVSYMDTVNEIDGSALSITTPINVVATDSGGSSEGWVVVTIAGQTSCPAAMYFGM